MWLHVMSICALQSSWPFGTYRAVVRFPFLPTQEISIITRQKRQAEIILSGAVNMRESFKYDRNEKHWNVQFGNQLANVLKTWHCKLQYIDFDFEKNVAFVWLSMPIIGAKKITLSRVEENDIRRLSHTARLHITRPHRLCAPIPPLTYK
jgi:hypothetical protein